jgi:hypothetical protein
MPPRVRLSALQGGYNRGVRPATLALILLVAAGAVVALTLTLAREDDEAPTVLVDERVGVLHGVRFGDSEGEVRARLGDPSDDHQGVFPEGADYTGPPAIPSPRTDQRPPRQPTPLHYDESAYLVSPTVGVFSMATLEQGARTRAGVGVGDDLELVRERYERVECGEAVAGEALFGGDTPMYPWCRAIVGDIRTFFGEDPIESITLTRYTSPRHARR